MRKYLLFPLFVSAIIIFCSFELLVQNPNSAQSDEEVRKEKLELEKFIKKFVKELEIHKDLNKVSSEFFAPKFKKIFAENEGWIKRLSNEDIYDQLTESERYEDNIAIANLISVGMIGIFHKTENFDDDLDSAKIKKFLSPSTIEIFRQSKWFRDVLDEEFEKVTPKTKEEWCDFVKDVKKIFAACRQELEKNSDQEKLNYTRNFTKWHNETESFSSYSCQGENCFGLAENTRIYQFPLFIMAISVVKIDSQFKVVNIHSAIVFN